MKAIVCSAEHSVPLRSDTTVLGEEEYFRLGRTSNSSLFIKSKDENASIESTKSHAFTYLSDPIT
jgi:hypothetical protein